MIKINCLSCGHTLTLDETYSDYEGQVKCYACSALLEIKLEDSLVKSVKFLMLTRSAAGENITRDVIPASPIVIPAQAEAVSRSDAA